jgi:hypothetical protein
MAERMPLEEFTQALLRLLFAGHAVQSIPLERLAAELERTAASICPVHLAQARAIVDGQLAVARAAIELRDAAVRLQRLPSIVPSKPAPVVPAPEGVH